ncbi:NmrA family NAD(P)-binding protein [Ensifer canadensis]
MEEEQGLRMYAVLGVSGKTGAATARALLGQNVALRAIVRDQTKEEIWAAKGAQVAVADIDNTRQLAAALNGTAATYLLNPPTYGAEDPFAEAERRAEIFVKAIELSDTQRVVVLSSISAHLPEDNGIIHTNYLFEQRLRTLAKPVAFLRAGYFFENWGHSLGSAKSEGILPSLLSRLSVAIPMVATADIGLVAAKLMQEFWTGQRVIELAGPSNTSPEEVAVAIGRALSRKLKAIAVPREAWPDIFAGAGMSSRAVRAFIEMYDGFNNGTIRFENEKPQRGSTTIVEAAARLVSQPC